MINWKFHSVTFNYWSMLLIWSASLCCWDVFIIEDKLELMLLSPIQYRMCSCTFLCGWIRKRPHSGYSLCETLLYFLQVPEPDGERWPICGRYLQPVCVSARWERYGAQGRSHRPAGLPSQLQCQHKPVLPSASSGLLRTGITGWYIVLYGLFSLVI